MNMVRKNQKLEIRNQKQIPISQILNRLKTVVNEFFTSLHMFKFSVCNLEFRYRFGFNTWDLRFNPLQADKEVL